MNPHEQPWFSVPIADSVHHPLGISKADHDEAVVQLNSLLRGEIAATETYRMAIEKLIKEGHDPTQVATLREVQREHGRTAQIFRKRISELRGISQDSSGTWGTWKKLEMGTAQLFGDSAALHALRDGEEQGLEDLRAAVEHLDAQSAELIEKVMIPAQARHVRRITALIGVMTHDN